MSTVFEGSYLGDASKLDDATALECGICWHVYDPTLGDDTKQVPAGTPFAALPDDWRCPNCDAPKQKFMVLGSARGTVTSDDPVERAIGAYRRIAATMRGLPIYNPGLIVDAVGFRTQDDGRRVGIVVTPWFMNLTALPAESDRRDWAPGQTRRLAFPSGEYDFHIGELEECGLIASCSLFSPMNDFTDHEAARLAAVAAIEALFQPDPQDAIAAPAPAAAPVTRRALLGAGT
ncbi:MAG: [NiFe]-hydrogenase assembly chaperone HybE [Steroidobacteraceae bacterium]